MVSVVIPACNAEQTIFQAVKAVRGQDLAEELEVVVVDDGSTDRTAAEARRAGALVICQANRGPAAARNTGWRTATGEIVLFTDSDCRPHQDWARKLCAGFTNMKVGAVAGSYGIWNSQSWLARYIHQEILNRHARMGKFIRAFGSYSVAVRKEVLERFNGFDESYPRASGEDNDFSYRMLEAGFTIAFRRDALVDHLHQESIFRYLKEQARHGYYRMMIYRRHPKMIGGDDYTRIKDIIEPPLALILLALLPFSLVVGGSLMLVVMGLALAYCLLQIVALLGEQWRSSGLKRWMYGGVTFLRGFARALGMAAGIIRFGLKNPGRT